MILISVIVPTYNRSNLLTLTLQSLLAQKIDQENFEVIIVDDGSTDNTGMIVQPFHDQFKFIRYIYLEKNGYRVARARNQGVKISAGELIVFLDSGMIAHPELLLEYLRLHNQYNGGCAIIGNTLGFAWDVLPEDLHLAGKTSDEVFDILTAYPGAQDIRNPCLEYFNFKLSESIAPWVLYWTCNVAVPKKQFLLIGGFDENFNTWGMEDIDIAFRLFNTGVNFIYGKSALAFHHPHEKNREMNEITDNINARYVAEKNRNIFTEMFYCSRSIMFNVQIDKLFKLKAHRATLKLSNDKVFLLDASERSVLLFGLFDFLSINIFPTATYIIDYDNQYCDEIQKRFPDLKVLNSIGAITLFPDSFFDKMIISESWLDFDESWLPKLFREWLRISKQVILFFESSETVPTIVNRYTRLQSVIGSLLTEIIISLNWLKTETGLYAVLQSVKTMVNANDETVFSKSKNNFQTTFSL